MAGAQKSSVDGVGMGMRVLIGLSGLTMAFFLIGIMDCMVLMFEQTRDRIYTDFRGRVEGLEGRVSNIGNDVTAILNGEVDYGHGEEYR